MACAKRQNLPFAAKLEIINRVERGEKKSDVATAYGSTFDEFVSADDDVAIMGQLQDEDYVADVVPTTSQSDSNKEIDDGPLPTPSEVISALALVRCYCVNMKGCSDSLDNVEACVLSEAAKSLKQKKIQDYFVPK